MTGRRIDMSRARVVSSLAAATVATLLAGIALGACVPQPIGRPTRPPAPSMPAVTPTDAPRTAGPTPTISFGRPTATPRPTFFSYRIRTGDTLTSIAREFRTTARSIGYWNRDRYPSLDPESAGYNPNTIRVGWTLLLVPGLEVDPDEITPPPSAASTPGSSGESGD